MVVPAATAAGAAACWDHQPQHSGAPASAPCPARLQRLKRAHTHMVQTDTQAHTHKHTQAHTQRHKQREAER
eukprot:1658266-Rhodomonas_salina.4